MNVAFWHQRDLVIAVTDVYSPELN